MQNHPARAWAPPFLAPPTARDASRADGYEWLEDERAPEVRSWMDSQDDAARRWLEALPGRDWLRRRLDAAMRVDSTGVPVERGGRLFYSRRPAQRDKAFWCWAPAGGDGAEVVLLDPLTLDPTGAAAADRLTPSPDGCRAVFAWRPNNADEAWLRLIDVHSGDVAPDVFVPGAKYGAPSWLPDGSGFYYTWVPPIGAVPVPERPGHATIRLHRLGTPASSDEIVFPATGDPGTFLGAQVSDDGEILLVTIHRGWNATSVWTRPLLPDGSGHAPEPFRALVDGEDAIFDVTAHRGALWVRTNWNAPRFRVLHATTREMPLEQWREIVPEEADRTLDAMGLAGERLLLQWQAKAQSTIELRDLAGGSVCPLDTGPPGSVDDISAHALVSTAYVATTSFQVPRQVWAIDTRAAGMSLWDEVRISTSATQLPVQTVIYPSLDGTNISMFVIGRQPPPGVEVPCLLTGYGGFSVSLTARFLSGLLPWLEAGGTIAIAHLRGGGEYGEEWHRAGMRGSKERTFEDFLGAADWLVAHGWTTPARLVIRGGSNGGLLVGVATVRRPEGFAGVICAVPLLDMLRYHHFGSGRTWIPEYGSPDIPEEREWLNAYSPYHHIAEGTPYPPVLFLSADSDDRVDPMHARKMAAVLQHASSSGNPILLRIEHQAGHGGADSVSQAIAQQLDALAFAAWCAGLPLPSVAERSEEQP